MFSVWLSLLYVIVTSLCVFNGVSGLRVLPFLLNSFIHDSSYGIVSRCFYDIGNRRLSTAGQALSYQSAALELLPWKHHAADREVGGACRLLWVIEQRIETSTRHWFP